jgi:hypothetical protein
MSMFVTSLLNFIIGYKTFLGIEKIPQKNGENKVLMKMGINSCVITYYNPYFYGSQEYYNVKQFFF